MTEITGSFKSFSNLAKKVQFFCKCLQCGDFLSSENFKVKQDFLKHYTDGDSVPFEDKLIEIAKTRNITKYEISVNKHTDYYEFGNAQVMMLKTANWMISYLLKA